ncbi:hypothetical protein LTSEALA_0197, partial [Salmonella enterica subsp. enterica serovar Alachua str. R6-377]
VNFRRGAGGRPCRRIGFSGVTERGQTKTRRDHP